MQLVDIVPNEHVFGSSAARAQVLYIELHNLVREADLAATTVQARPQIQLLVR